MHQSRERSNSQETLVTLSDPRSPVAEAYRALRTNIQFSSLDRPIHTLLVTSSSPDEGKSTTLANLAVTMGQAGSGIILVDCDLRRPVLHQLFGLSNAVGLTNAVLDAGATTLPLQETGVVGLRFLATGPLPPNPSELLGSKRMGTVIDALLQEADLVLFDSPPVLAVTDAAILASRLDAVILVVCAGKTRRELARRAKMQLEKVNARLLGVVLNNAKLDMPLYHYYSQQEG